MKPLGVIPTYVSEPRDVAFLADCVKSIRATEGDGIDLLIVDDGSPEAAMVAALAEETGVELHVKDNEGFARTVNVGLQRALDEGRDAVLINQDIEFEWPWLDAMLGQRSLSKDEPAAVVGGLLCYPSGLIQHAGVYFSLLTRTFDHLHKFGPMNLPEAQEPRICPVTGALQLIRHSTLAEVGIYDPEFRMGWEDVDYCLRVLLAGHECVYAPSVRAIHHESIFRSRSSEKLDAWHRSSFVRLATKYQAINFVNLVPAL